MDTGMLASDRQLDNILDLLILTQSRVDEAYLSRATTLSREQLRVYLDSLIKAKYVRAVTGFGNKKLYESTATSWRFFNDNFRRMIPDRFKEDDFHEVVVSVIIPAFNEEKTLGSIIQRTREVLQSLEIPYEIIVVDDGSSDGTGEIAYCNGVTLIKNGLNSGKGHAMRLGFQKARGSFIVTMDADGSHRPEEISRLLYPLLSNNLGAHAVVGSRFIGEIEDGSITRLHLLGNKFFDLSVKMLTGKQVSDTQSGFRAFKRKVVEKMALRSGGFEIEAEMIMRVLKEGLTAFEVPITCRKRQYGYTRVRSFMDGFKILRVIVQTSLGF